jgi:hypothetical protein
MLYFLKAYIENYIEENFIFFYLLFLYLVLILFVCIKELKNEISNK